MPGLTAGSSHDIWCVAQDSRWKDDISRGLQAATVSSGAFVSLATPAAGPAAAYLIEPFQMDRATQSVTLGIMTNQFGHLSCVLSTSKPSVAQIQAGQDSASSSALAALKRVFMVASIPTVTQLTSSGMTHSQFYKVWCIFEDIEGRLLSHLGGDTHAKYGLTVSTADCGSVTPAVGSCGLVNEFALGPSLQVADGPGAYLTSQYCSFTLTGSADLLTPLVRC